MIQYRLDTRSGVAPYLQLVRQTKSAMRLGMLHPGDQLPTVKEVVGAIAINPNTVLKAYRELEREGLVEGRPGVGTFVLRSLGGPRLTDSPQLRRRLAKWMADARAAGLDEESISTLFDATLRGSLDEEGIA
jgi:DNA-binding transcriptional regulator YhcF (GntR family)